ncbi:MAG: hypothetical protein RR185_07425, partial [Angelakisella sp.]
MSRKKKKQEKQRYVPPQPGLTGASKPVVAAAPRQPEKKESAINLSPSPRPAVAPRTIDSSGHLSPS